MIKYYWLVIALVAILSLTIDIGHAESSDFQLSDSNISSIIEATYFPEAIETPEIKMGESYFDKEQREKAEEAARIASEQRKAYQQYLARQRPITSRSVSVEVPASIPVGSPQTPLNLCSCVEYVIAVTGIHVGSIGFARNWPRNSAEPAVGGVVITRESKAGHVARIIGIEGDDLILDEANYDTCHKTTGRHLNRHSPLIAGYYVP